ncbi:MAG: PEGA domain-containing protein [Thermoanaerobaculaceae bacterium]|nr:PEGA domain-containing protein [Thermoanaerobaculaceae bacterium]
MRVSPGNAAVYIDGVFTGSGDELARLQRGGAVAPGDHRIDVVAPGHTGKSVRVEVATGQVQDVVLALE